MMMKKTARMLALLLCLLLPLSACAQSQTQEPVNLTQLLSQHTTLDLTPYLGKTVVLNFFTEWCAYCMKEMPDLKAVNDLYDPAHFQMVLVHVWDGEDAANTQSVQARYGMEHMTFFEDTDCAVAAAVGLPGYPATLIVDAQGAVTAGQSGMITQEALSAYLDEQGVPRAVEEP